MSEARVPMQTVLIAGAGQLGVLTAIALKRALPSSEITLLQTPPHPAAWADRIGTALPFTNRLHDRLGIDEAAIIRQAGGSHRLITRMFGWGGDGHVGAASHSVATDPALRSAFARDWGGGPRNSSSTPRQPESLAELLANSGRFGIPDGAAGNPLADIDYGLRWNVPAYHALLAQIAQRSGVGYLIGGIEGVIPDAAGGISAVSIAGHGAIAADLFIDCSGPHGAVLSRLPQPDRVDWSASLAATDILAAPPGAPMLALEDRCSLIAKGWLAEIAGRDGLQTMVGVAPGVDHADACRALGHDQPEHVPLAAGRVAQPWVGNVIALGDATAQLHPLGGLPLDLAHRQLALLLDLLPANPIEPLERAEFNRRAVLMADAAHDVQAIYYLAPAALWVFGAKTADNRLELALDQFTRRGRLPFQEEAPLLGPELESLLIALGFPRGISVLDQVADRAAAEAARLAFAAQTRAALAAVPPYPQAMDALMQS